MTKTDTDNVKKNYSKPETANVLIVDDDSELIRFMLEIAARKGIRANLAGDEKAALDFLGKSDCNLVFTAARISPRAGLAGHPRGGFELLRKIRENSPEIPVVMMAEAQAPKSKNEKHGAVNEILHTAVEAIRAGCCDFLVKPLERKKIESLLDTFLPNHDVASCASANDGLCNLYTIVGRSPKLVQTIRLAEKIAPTSVPVLIRGESGTGKELISYLVHHKSKRAQGPYIKVNCAALSDTLLESELFGHEKGAFTGAYTRRKGRFEMAHGGTLLLDEITETPLKFQAKLLRILEQQDFERVGGNENVRVDVRIISTSNRDLLQEVAEGRFRSDLYYRLSGVRLLVSPLRDRTEDLSDLIWHFVNLYAHEAQRQITKLDPAMMGIFAKYHWPGNIRQLRNVVLTSLILGVGPMLSLADVSWLFDELQPLPQEQRNSLSELPNHFESEVPTASGLGGVPLEQVERRAILDTLHRTAGNQAKAAKVLGISDRTLRGKLRRYRQQGSLQLT